MLNVQTLREAIKDLPDDTLVTIQTEFGISYAVTVEASVGPKVEYDRCTIKDDSAR